MTKEALKVYLDKVLEGRSLLTHIRSAIIMAEGYRFMNRGAKGEWVDEYIQELKNHLEDRLK